MSFYGNSKEWLEIYSDVPCNIERLLRVMTKDQLDRVQLLLPKFREELRDNDWLWDEDGVWKKIDADGRILASVWQGNDYYAVPGQHWLWGLGEPAEPENYYTNNCQCPFEARDKADAALKEKI
jgi:hypothetical protein